MKRSGAVRTSLLFLFLLTAPVPLLLSCKPPPKIAITSPANGAMIDASNVLVTGTTNRNNLQVLVNGVSATVGAGTWSATIPLDTAGVMTPIDAEMVNGTGTITKDRITVLAGPSIAEGSYSPEALGLAFTNTGLDALLPLVESLAGGAFDISSLLTGGGPLFDTTFATFDVTGTAYDFDVGPLSMDASSTTDQIDAVISLQDMHIAIEMNMRDNLAIDMWCKMELDIPSIAIDASYTMSPEPSSPSNVDVNQIGDAVVTIPTINWKFIDGPCDPDAPVIGWLINVVLEALGFIEDLMADGFKDNLKDPDGAGPLDSPIADGIEQALAGIDIAGEVGGAVGLMLNAPINSITEDATGVVLNTDASFIATIGTGPGECDAPAGAPDLTESFHVPSVPPTFGVTAPGGDPYSLGLAISSSAFNQLFKGMIECGLLSLEVTEVAFGQATIPLDTGLLGLIGMPQFVQILGAGTPMMIRIVPKMAPFATGNPGPAGEMAELAMPFLVMEIVNPADDKVWLTLAIDTRFGLDLAFDEVNAELAPVVTAPTAANTLARVLTNKILANEQSVEATLPLVVPLFFNFFGSAFGSFPLPTFFGLQLEIVEIASGGGLFSIYANLNQSPATRIENVVLADQTPNGDHVTDGTVDVEEWRHKTKLTSSPSTVDTRYRSVIAADACCTLDDHSISETAAYRVEFDVTPENGDTWQLDINHRLLGALTTVDEANGSYDGSELAEFTTPIQGSYSIDGGPFVPFNFDPAPLWSIFDDFDGFEGDINVEVSGTNNVRLIGTNPSHIVLDFSWGMHVYSDSSVAFPAIDGGEGAVRLGMHDTIELGTAPSAGFSAGHYPGQGGRDIGADGHFVDVDLTAWDCTGQPGCAICGDGVVTSPEACDDGNGVDGDGCDDSCALESGFNCSGEPTSCLPICGDGLIVYMEGCDDGGLTGGDGCSVMCHEESGWACSGEPSTCDGICGDGLVRGSEPCDDGNSNYGDGCRPTCTPEICGDGILDPGEACDDGNTNSGDGCNGACTGSDAGCQMGGNSCRVFDDPFNFLGRNCTSSTLCIETAGWYLLQGTTNGTSLNDYDIHGQPHNLNDIETAQTRSDYNYLNPGTYTVEACDNTGLGISTSQYCVLAVDRISAPGSVNGSLNDSPDLDSGTGEIDLAGPISGGDHCYAVDVVTTGSYRVVASHNSGGGLLAAGLYGSTPPNGLIAAVGDEPSPIPVGQSGNSAYVTLNEGTTYHLCADTATLGSNINFTLTLEAR